MKRYVAWVAAVFCLLNACLAGEIASKPLTQSQAQQLAQKYFAETDAAKKEAILAQSPDGSVAPNDILPFLQFVAPVGNPAAKLGSTQNLTLTVRPEISEKPVEYALHLPSQYTPGRPCPLIIGLHGGGEDFGSGKEFMQSLLSGGNVNAILACPTSVDRTIKLYWRSLKNQDMFEALIAELSRQYSIDRNRVYLCGYSMGGIASYYWAEQMSDQFAAVGPGGGAWGGMYWPALLNTPLYIFHGKRDMRGKMFTDFPYAQNAADAMRELGYTCEFRAMDCDHSGVPPREFKTMMDWMLSKTRVPYAKHVILSSTKALAPHGPNPISGADRWLKIDEIGDQKLDMPSVELGGTPKTKTPTKMGTLDAVWTAKNVLTVKAENVKRFRVFITPELMDVLKPLKITVNGATVYEGPVTTSYKFLIKYLDVHRDPTMVFIGETLVSVDASK